MEFLTLTPTLVLSLFLLTVNTGSAPSQSVDLKKQTWIHGSERCGKNTDPGMQVVRYNASTYIIRQNKCLNYEAPFIYLFIGDEKALLVDTGAGAPHNAFPLYETVMKILKGSVPLIVVHSHGHGDHNAHDQQFANKAHVRLIPAVKDSITSVFRLKGWPHSQRSFELGNRTITVIPIPGHDDQSIALYDHQTRWLLTGDTVYPGRLYVRDGKAFRASITRLYAFSKEYPVSYVMGNHIEMTTTKGKDYPAGTTFQPSEHVLPLDPSVLKELHHACERMGDQTVYQVHDDFIIVPKS